MRATIFVAQMMKKITQIESLNYYLYLIIVLLAGIVFFVASYFSSSKVVEYVNLNEVDKSLVIKNISDSGFDIEVKSVNEVKIRYFVGTDPQILNLFYETNSLVREDLFQYRSLINGKTKYLQVEFEKSDGSKLKSQIKEISK